MAKKRRTKNQWDYMIQQNRVTSYEQKLRSQGYAVDRMRPKSYTEKNITRRDIDPFMKASPIDIMGAMGYDINSLGNETNLVLSNVLQSIKDEINYSGEWSRPDSQLRSDLNSNKEWLLNYVNQYEDLSYSDKKLASNLAYELQNDADEIIRISQELLYASDQQHRYGNYQELINIYNSALERAKEYE